MSVMKKALIFLAAAGLVSATPITLNTVLYLASSDLESIPTGTAYAVGTRGGGGLCPGDYTTCPNIGAVGSVITSVLTFTLSQSSTLNIILQDRSLVGDVYDVMLSNNSLGTSVIDQYQSVPVQLNGTAAAGAACWTGISFSTNQNSCLNVNTGVLAAGNYSITVWDILISYIGSNDPFGGGAVPNPGGEGGISWSPASFSLQVNSTAAAAIPEPGTFALLGLGGIALGLIRRRTAK